MCILGIKSTNKEEILEIIDDESFISERKSSQDSIEINKSDSKKTSDKNMI